jgi:hypothetical protein
MLLSLAMDNTGEFAISIGWGLFSETNCSVFNFSVASFCFLAANSSAVG